MRGYFIATVLFGLLSFACAQVKTVPRAGQVKSPGGEAASSPSLGAAAAKVQDVCSLVPMDLVEKLVPGASEPTREEFPKRCTFSNGKSVLEITFDNGPDEPVNGAEFIGGLARGGYLERLDPHNRGDIYLTVILGRDETGTNRNLHVEVAGHDGQDHKDDAIQVARAVLGKLNG